MLMVFMPLGDSLEAKWKLSVSPLLQLTETHCGEEHRACALVRTPISPSAEGQRGQVVGLLGA